MHRRLALALLLIVATGAQAASSGVQPGTHLRLELLSEHAALAPDSEHVLALRIEHDPHWHTYWQIPGDSGLPTTIRWTLPDGIEASAIDWPYPQRLPAGPLTNYGYEGETWLLTTLRTPTSLPAATGSMLTITADVSYLVCKEECIPGKATLQLSLPVADTLPAVAADSARFDLARSKLPVTNDALAGQISEAGEDRLRVALTGPVPDTFELFPMDDSVFATRAFSGWANDGRALAALHERGDLYAGLPEMLPMLLVDTTAQPARAYRFELTRDEQAASTATTTPGGSVADAGTSGTSGVSAIGLASALLLAFLGGVVLNLMPCVLPVLSLKALTFGQLGGDQRKARREGVFYTLGVLASFAAIGLLLIVLRAGGEQIGWGFQLQSPVMVAALAYLMFLLGLGLSGATTLGSGWMGIGQRLTEGGGDRAAFFTGVLACIVAAPCTAPFMGAALGFAVTQPAPIAMSVFLVLGLGLAAPLALIAMVPALARHLPKPGAWMDTFKQVLAFPMYLTAVGLMWVLTQQTGANGVALALLGLVLLAFAAWLWERGTWQGRRSNRVVATISLAAALALLPLTQRWASPGTQSGGSLSGSEVRAWNAETLADLRTGGEPVLVNMTAAWCITCKVNESVALSSQAFHDRLRQHGIHYLKGDWTTHDPAISAYLAQFDRVGVPLYVLYPRGTGEPQVLPQILTPTGVLAALDDAVASH